MLQGTVSVVTGASRGIGRAIAAGQAAAGATVAVVARNPEALDAVAADITSTGGTAAAFAGDVSDRADVERIFAAIAADLGPVDTLINNAGAFAAIGPLWEVDPDAWWSDIEINLKSVFHCSRAVLPSMLARGRGRIVTMIGGGTVRPMPYGSGYSISKTGTLRFTECLAASLEGTGVVCLAMDPGLVKTDLTQYQADSPAAARYMPGVVERLRTGDHVPPERAARLAIAIAAGCFDRMAGRAIGATEDLAAVEASIDAILAADERVLRVPGFAPPPRPAGDVAP
ncbi:SDR family NAD(P)-dependent oxidoreductase [Mongoliimonas terrestris]|uniref:SDR family NAD(P)-dependent oxidoreductase n=1 Tax=Mongoliimonas terrestris TaxID=1709001 RepID=UPI0009499273|nr:SDR family NAD(P)-dependent oxidoreductase [Mongoliimonas terrestris]